MKIVREEPMFVKIRKKAEDFPQWIHLKLPQGRYKVNAPMEHRLICKEAQLITDLKNTELYANRKERGPIAKLKFIGHVALKF